MSITHLSRGRPVVRQLEALWGSRLWRWGLSLVPLALLLVHVLRWGVDLPFWDQWALVPHLEALYEGHLDLLDLWQLHNEHRPFVPKLLMLGAAYSSHWNIRLELALNVLLAVASFLCLFRLLTGGRALSDVSLKRRLGLLPVLSILLFNFTQVENWTWGWQLQIFLNLFAVCAGLLLLLPASDRTGTKLIAAALLGWVASYSFANGLLYWLVALPLVTLGESGPKRRSTLWLASTAACWLSFVPLQGEAAPELQTAPLPLALYAVTYLGAPLFPKSTLAAGCAGAAGVVCFLYLGSRLLGSARHAADRRFVLAWSGLGLYAISSGLVTAAGRSHLGLEQALSSRYITISQLLWAALATLFVRWSENGTDPLLRRRAWAVPVLLCLFLLLSVRSLETAPSFRGQYVFKRELQHILLTDPRRPEVARLHPNVDSLRARQEILRRHRLSYFRSPPDRELRAARE